MNNHKQKSRWRVAHFLHLDGPGGGPTTVINQVKHMKNRFETIVFHGGCGRLARACESMKIEHHQLPIDRLGKCAWGFFVLLHQLRKTKPDLLILHGQWAGPLGALAGRLAGIRRLVYVAQWPAFYTDWDLWRVFRNYFAEKIPCRLSDKVLTVTESGRCQYLVRRLVSEENLLVTVNPIDLSRVPSQENILEIRKKEGWEDGLRHVVSVGRLVDQKRVDWLLRSWEIVARSASTARLWIVGDGDERAELEELARRLNLGRTCTLLGSRENGIDYVAAADIVAMTSMYESQGLVQIEGMACGKPIVASRVDGIAYSFENGVEGFLVAPGDIKTFAECLLALVHSPELRLRMGEAGRQSAKRYDMGKVLDDCATLYSELLSG